MAHPEYYPLALLVEQMERWGARWLVIENVCGLVWSPEGREEIGRLADAVKARPGLTWTTTIVRSSDHGVRQLRRRPIIVVGPSLCPILAGAVSPIDDDSSRTVAASNRGGFGERFERTVSATRGGRNGSERTVRAVRGGGRDSAAYAKRSVYASASKSAMHDPRSGEVNYSESRSIEECAALQCVPVEPLAGLSRTAQYRLVGNAVPPPVAEWVIRCVLAEDARGAAFGAAHTDPPADIVEAAGVEHAAVDASPEDSGQIRVAAGRGEASVSRGDRG